ncbi:MAG: PilW family protein [Proteobacteria bacterium]|nr:PilW family protein [Pseudomonadota bacterium]
MKPHKIHLGTNLLTSIWHKQRGLSLVELMIAMALSLIIVAAIAQLFASMSRANQEMAKTSSQIENARFTMQFITSDLIHAGYWGSFVPEFDDLTFDDVAPTDFPANVPDPCAPASFPLSDTILDQLIGLPIQVYNAVPTACSTVLPNKLADTDVLVVRHANTCAPGDTNCEADVSGKLYFQASNCDTELGSVVLPNPLNPNYAFDPNGHTRTQIDCTTLESKRKVIQNIYYIRDYAVTIGDGIPTLMRSEFDLVGGTLAQQAAVALVEGIERFRVELGIDKESDTNLPVDPNSVILWADTSNLTSPTNRGNGIPEPPFIHCGTGCTAYQLANVVSVKLYILARADVATPGYTDTKDYKLGSPAAIGPFNDSFKRHVFSTTIRLNNIAGRRETP